MTTAALHPGSGRPGTVWCIVVAAGSGSRFGGAKQFEQLGGRRVVDRSVETAASSCDGVIAVMPPGDTAVAAPQGADLVVAGDSTRSGSVRAGLAVLPDDATVVLVHDAARPLATRDLFERVIAAIRAGAAAAVPVVDVVDTMRSLSGGIVDRSDLRAVQTPQGFEVATLRRAHAADSDATDDAGLVEAAGGAVALVDGERTNLKLTERGDLVVAEALLADRDRLGGDSPT